MITTVTDESEREASQKHQRELEDLEMELTAFAAEVQPRQLRAAVSHMRRLLLSSESRSLDEEHRAVLQRFVDRNTKAVDSARDPGVEVRKQYHLRPSPRGLLAWDVHRLIALTRDLPRKEVPLDAIGELNEPFWFQGRSAPPTCREVADHARLMMDADLGYPIILGADGRVMDGMHRVALAYIIGEAAISAVQFDVDPDPDYVGVDEASLPYDD